MWSPCDFDVLSHVAYEQGGSIWVLKSIDDPGPLSWAHRNAMPPGGGSNSNAPHRTSGLDGAFQRGETLAIQ